MILGTTELFKEIIITYGQGLHFFSERKINKFIMCYEHNLERDVNQLFLYSHTETGN
jgi:hypothetical protein